MLVNSDNSEVGTISLPDKAPTGWMTSNEDFLYIDMLTDSEFQGGGFAIDYVPATSSGLAWQEADCSWLAGSAGQDVACPAGQIVTGLCNSLAADVCSGNTQEIKCCPLTPEVMVQDSCATLDTEAADCGTAEGGLYSFVTGVCSSLVDDQCSGGAQFSKVMSHLFFRIDISYIRLIAG